MGKRRDLQRGDVFLVCGYDLVAQAQYAGGDGEAIVLCNSSTHYLVAGRMFDATDAQFDEAFRYGPPHEAADYAYASALRAMVALAVRS